MKKPIAVLGAILATAIFSYYLILPSLAGLLMYVVSGNGNLLKNGFGGITFIQSDLSNYIEGTISGYSYTYIIPDSSNGLNTLITRNDTLFGVNTKDKFKNTKYSSIPFTGFNIDKQVLGCNIKTKTCYILQLKYLDYPYYQPTNILSYQYDTQTFSTIYTFNQELPEIVTFIDKASKQTVIASKLNYQSSTPGFTQTTQYFILNIETGSVVVEKNYNSVPKQNYTHLSFDKNDENFILKGTENGVLTGDELFGFLDKTTCAGGGFGGCDTKVTIYEYKTKISSFTCHNCMVRYLGKDADDIFLLIIDDIETKIGSMKIKALVK